MSVFVQVKGIEEGCLAPQVMRAIESFDFQVRSVTGVQSVQSVAGMGKNVISGNNEGNPRWSAIPGSERGLSQGARAYMPDDGLVTEGCQRMQILVFLTNHEGATVSHVVNETQRIIAVLLLTPPSPPPPPASASAPPPPPLTSMRSLLETFI